MKIVSIVIPTYNENDNVIPVYEKVKEVFFDKLVGYDYRILYIDNCSQDGTKVLIRELAFRDKKVEYIFNARNFGYARSSFYGLTQSVGDCTILLSADMQEPPELIPKLVREWENGNKVVIGIKNKSKENHFMYWGRSLYYKFINKITDVHHISQFMGFGLYDKSIIKVFSNLDDPLPYFRGIVAELAPEGKKIYYEQNRRERGKSSFHFMNLYDMAMLGITSYSKTLMRISTAVGFVVAIASIIFSLINVILKASGVVSYPLGLATIICGIFLLGGIQLMFLGVLGEYISNINIRTMNRPLVVEEERGNFD